MPHSASHRGPQWCPHFTIRAIGDGFSQERSNALTLNRCPSRRGRKAMANPRRTQNKSHVNSNNSCSRRLSIRVLGGTSAIVRLFRLPQFRASGAARTARRIRAEDASIMPDQKDQNHGENREHTHHLPHLTLLVRRGKSHHAVSQDGIRIRVEKLRCISSVMRIAETKHPNPGLVFIRKPATVGCGRGVPPRSRQDTTPPAGGSRIESRLVSIRKGRVLGSVVGAGFTPARNLQ